MSRSTLLDYLSKTSVLRVDLSCFPPRTAILSGGRGSSSEKCSRAQVSTQNEILPGQSSTVGGTVTSLHRLAFSSAKRGNLRRATCFGISPLAEFPLFTAILMVRQARRALSKRATALQGRRSKLSLDFV